MGCIPTVTWEHPSVAGYVTVDKMSLLLSYADIKQAPDMFSISVSFGAFTIVNFT